MKLIEHFGVKVMMEHMTPTALYKAMALNAFLMDDQTPYADALRRGLKLLYEGEYRLTPEFEQAIQVESSIREVQGAAVNVKA